MLAPQFQKQVRHSIRTSRKDRECRGARWTTYDRFIVYKPVSAQVVVIAVVREKRNAEHRFQFQYGKRAFREFAERNIAQYRRIDRIARVGLWNTSRRVRSTLLLDNLRVDTLFDGQNRRDIVEIHIEPTCAADRIASGDRCVAQTPWHQDKNDANDNKRESFSLLGATVTDKPQRRNDKGRTEYQKVRRADKNCVPKERARTQKPEVFPSLPRDYQQIESSQEDDNKRHFRKREPGKPNHVRLECRKRGRDHADLCVEKPRSDAIREERHEDASEDGEEECVVNDSVRDERERCD